MKRMLLFLPRLPPAGVFWCLLLNGLCLLCSVVLLEAALQSLFTLQILGGLANVLTVITCTLLFQFCICV